MEPLLSELTGKNDLLKHALIILVAVLTGMVLRWLVFWFLMIYQKRKRSVLKEQLLMSLKIPIMFLWPLLFVYASFFILKRSLFWYTVTDILIIVNFTWALIATLSVAKLLAKLKTIVQDEALWYKNVAELVLVDT